MNTNAIFHFRRRFVKDFNLPINLIDNPFFDYYRNKYHFFPKQEYENCLMNIENNFNGNIQIWLDRYSELRDNIITTIENSEPYKEFIQMNMSQYLIKDKEISSNNIYNEQWVGSKFISIDLKTANFQALKFINPQIVLNCNTYDELIEKFGGDEYLKKSKYTRQVIFGKLNPKRTIQVEKYLIWQILNNTDNKTLQFIKENCELISVGTDEIIFKINSDFENNINLNLLDDIRGEIEKNNKLSVKVETFHLTRIVTKNHNGNIVDGYLKKYYLKNIQELKSTSSIFFPQIYAIAFNQEFHDLDMYFSAENQTAKFIEPLTLIEVQGE